MIKIGKILIFLSAVSIVGYLLYKNSIIFEDVKRIEEKVESSSIKNMLSIEVDGKEYVYAWIQISNPENLFLVPNFEEKYTLSEIVSKYSCKNVASGGFYTETNSPIGLFISEAGKLSNEVESELFNGYFTLTKKNAATISRTYLGESVRIGLQTGPILFYNGVVQGLTLTSDKMARRNVVALTKESEIYFITFYDKESVFIGPLLVDLPEIVNSIQSEIGVEFNSVINLDGGTASALYSQDIQLSELSPVGSFFCER